MKRDVFLIENQEIKTSKVALLSITASFMWGFNYPGVKIIISYLPPLFTVGFRFLLMGLMLMPILIYLKKPLKKDMTRIMISSLLVYAIPLGAHGLAFQWLDSSIIALSSQLDPIVMIFMGAIFYKEKISSYQIFGLVVAILGVYFVMKSPEIDVRDFKSVICLVIPIFSWAAGILYTRQIKLSGALITGYSLLMASIPVLVSSFIFEEQHYQKLLMMPHRFWVLYFLMCCFTIGANCIYTYMIKKVEVGRTAPYLLTIPIFSIIAGFFLIDEKLDEVAIFGGSLILFGVLISTFKFKKRIFGKMFISK